jgi:hypothetical protein
MRNGVDQNEINIMKNVKLESLRVSPDSIGPFGQATLNWAVTGPDGFGVQLNGLDVVQAGSMTVKPPVSTVYTVVATTGSASKLLGSVNLSVDTSTCITVEAISNFRASLLQDCIGSVLGANPTVSLRTVNDESQTTVPQDMWFTPGFMNLGFHLYAAESIRVALDVSIMAGFRVDGGAIVPAGSVISATISGGLTLAVVGLFVNLHISDKEQIVEMDFNALVNAIPQFLTFGYLITSKMRYQNLSIPGDPTDPPFTIVACPAPPDKTLGILGLSSGGTRQT